MTLFKRFLIIMTSIAIAVAAIAVLWFNMYRYFLPNSVLKSSESSYLQNHKHDLVKWHTWSPETLTMAKKQNKPLFISIGFATCYGCRVMKHESFRNPLIAKIINRYYVPILIDRYQQPRIDKIYIHLLDYQKGMSGWPTTVLATPDGIPLFLSTYEPKDNFKKALTLIAKDWAKQSSVTQVKALKWADRYAESKAVIPRSPFNDPRVDLNQFLVNAFDTSFGGMGQRQKFPLFLHWSQLIMLSPDYFSYAKQTMDKILTSPLFDFIEGGVHRYSSTRDWRNPHFEKIFIDQVHFVQLLTQLYSITEEPLYLDLAVFNVSFILNNFQTESGQFMTGLDSGDLFESGLYYYFSDDFLDELSPLPFERVSVGNYQNLSALMNPKDFYGIDQSPLINKRKNSNVQLQKDHFVSIQHNAKFLISLLYLNQWVKSSDYQKVIERLMDFLVNQPFQTLSPMTLLVVYDALSSTTEAMDLSELEFLIRSRLNPMFPFYTPLPYVLPQLQVMDYLDSDHSPQALYYLLKHRQKLLIGYTDATMCSDLSKVIGFPWNQLSLVKIYNTSCQ